MFADKKRQLRQMRLFNPPLFLIERRVEHRSVKFQLEAGKKFFVEKALRFFVVGKVQDVEQAGGAFRVVMRLYELPRMKE